VLALYRRHTAKCLAELASRDWKAKSSEEIKVEIRDWRFCSCPLWREGSYGRIKYERRTLNTSNWKVAERLLANLMREADQNIIDPQRINLTIHDALQRWHVACCLIPLADTTMVQHRHLGDTLVAFCKGKRITMLTDVDATIINQWRAEGWAGARTSTKRKQFSVTRTFFDYCVSQGWLALHPMRDMIVPRDADDEDAADTMPLDLDGTDTNFDRLIAALASVEPTAARTHKQHDPSVTPRQCGCVACRREHGRLPAMNPARTHPLREPARIVGLVKLMRYSGMRISDALRFDVNTVTVNGNIATVEFLPWKTRKFRRKCTSHMPVEVFHEIAALRPLSPGRPFIAAPTLVNSARTIVWQVLQAAGEAAGLPGVHAHRLRNQFAVCHLVGGALIQEVSSWLGHASVATTQKFYSPWVRGLADASLAAYSRSMDRQRA
jgi:site-specific recombinase XerD